jgi:GNAT superfamily N-acetyltransferase
MVPLELEEMREEDIDEAAMFVAYAMNEAEGDYARRTMRFHFGCRRCGHDDGRSYYVWRRAGKLGGLVGLHNYLWGPEENVWLSWFAVAGELRGRGYGRALLRRIRTIAVEHGYRKMFIETYSGAEFSQARAFYEKMGFVRVGGIPGYMSDGADMLVYFRTLA